jgi:hypothetical protein
MRAPCSYFIHISSELNLKPEIVFQNMDIKYKNETNFLGLCLTEDVKWDVHINMCVIC